MEVYFCQDSNQQHIKVSRSSGKVLVFLVSFIRLWSAVGADKYCPLVDTNHRCRKPQIQFKYKLSVFQNIFSYYGQNNLAFADGSNRWKEGRNFEAITHLLNKFWFVHFCLTDKPSTACIGVKRTFQCFLTSIEVKTFNRRIFGGDHNWEKVFLTTLDQWLIKRIIILGFTLLKCIKLLVLNDRAGLVVLLRSWTGEGLYSFNSDSLVELHSPGLRSLSDLQVLHTASEGSAAGQSCLSNPSWKTNCVQFAAWRQVGW